MNRSQKKGHTKMTTKILNQLTTAEVQDLFLVLLSPNNGNITKTCEQIGMSRETYYNWCKDESFSARLLHIAEERLDIAEDALLSAVKMLDVGAIKYLLDAQGRSRGYGQASKFEISGPDGTPIAGTVDVTHYPPEPETMLEWEEQVAASRAIREAEKVEKDKQIAAAGDDPAQAERDLYTKNTTAGKHPDCVEQSTTDAEADTTE